MQSTVQMMSAVIKFFCSMVIFLYQMWYALNFIELGYCSKLTYVLSLFKKYHAFIVLSRREVKYTAGDKLKMKMVSQID